MSDAPDPAAIALKPCPFCGGAFKMAQEPHDNGFVAGMFYIFHARNTDAARKCRLEINGHFDRETEAVAFWNRRAELEKGNG